MMAFVAERQIRRGRFEVFVDRDPESQEVRVSVYRGDTLLAIDFIRPLEAIIDGLVAAATQRAPQFPNGERQ
jgi:hypothetical protein